MEHCERFCTGTLRRKPQLFLTCCFFSLLIGGISSLYFYYPEDSVSPRNGQYPFHQLQVSAAEEADIIEQEHNEHLNLMEQRDSSRNYGAISASELSPMFSQSTNSVVVLDSDSNSTSNNISSSSNGSIRNESEKMTENSSPGQSQSQNTKFRHHHSENPIMFMKLNELVEQSKFTNVIERRLIHFDLKGAPPKVGYFKEIIKLSQEAGLTGLLIEWEDTFPWRDNLKNLTQKDNNYYTLAQVQEIINFAEVHGLEVIPLVQTFGHVEFILKQEEFSHLREVDEDPQAFCPSKPETMSLIEDMILQITQVHQNSRFIHIGCDEIYNLRVCNLCTSTSEAKDVLFMDHVTKVARFVRKLGKIPIMWDDMLRMIPRQKLVESSLGSLVEPMVWVYAEDVDRFVGWETWEKYSEVFPTIWVAGAYKGAFGETLTIPKLTRHAENTQRWVDIVARESHRWEKGVGGIVLTGWSRYDHFAVLCELLPASLPSLVYSSLITSIVSPAASIRNRVFVSALAQPSTSGGGNSNAGAIGPIRRRRSVRRWVPHPQSLRIKERAERVSMASFARVGLPATVETGLIHDDPFQLRQEKIATEFLRILNCPVTLAMTKIVLTAKNSEDDEFSFVSRCNFPGVSFFRTMFRLRSLQNEVWDLTTSLNLGRGWVTKYNRRHHFSLPLRVDELIKDIPRLKRNLALTAKSVGISMKALYSHDTILEWLEQNIWEAWENLDELEKAGRELKSIKIWPRRPLESPDKMTTDLGLQILGLDNGGL